MGYDLVSYNGEELNMGRAWPGMLDLARTYGWEPRGTTQSKEIIAGMPNPAAGQPWSGGYLSNDYQTVSDADAFALRDALQRAKTALEPAQRKSARIRAMAGSNPVRAASAPSAANVSALCHAWQALPAGRRWHAAGCCRPTSPIYHGATSFPLHDGLARGLAGSSAKRLFSRPSCSRCRWSCHSQGAGHGAKWI
jgi:hypothetical protein